MMGNNMVFALSSFGRNCVLNLSKRGKILNILWFAIGYEIQSVYDFAKMSIRISYLEMFNNDKKQTNTFGDLPTSAWGDGHVLFARNSTVAKSYYYVGKSKPSANDISRLKQTGEIYFNSILNAMCGCGALSRCSLTIPDSYCDGKFLVIQSSSDSWGSGAFCITFSNPQTFVRECSGNG